MIRVALPILLLAGIAFGQTAKDYGTPGVTPWVPGGCRAVAATNAVTPAPIASRNLHADGIASDEVSIALAPRFHEAWTAEGATYNVTGPVFDSAGNLYFAPLRPYENVALVSLDPATGARRWAVPGTGAPAGSSAPMVLRDPGSPGGEIVYLALYDRVLAVRTDGTTVWDVPSGLDLSSASGALDAGVLGTNYAPSTDAVVGLAKDGHVFAVDRATGAPVLNAPYALPGEKTPPGTPLALPPSLVTAAEDLLQGLVDMPDGSLQGLVSVLLGNDSEVSNMFSVDPWTSRLWIAATAPDAEDGTIDGRSELGALFRLEFVPSGTRYDLVEACHRSFAGGTASTPTLSADGARIYLGDNFGKLIAVRDDCTDAWELDLGAQIFGSVAVTADGHEIYASTAAFIAKVIDEGTSGRLVWTATIDPFTGLGPGQRNFNLNLVTAAANGLAFQAGAGTIAATGTVLPAAVGVGIIDRATGTIRSFTAGGEETVAVMDVGPDGAMYVGNSPLRRLFAQVLGLSPAPIRGGITKFVPERLDLLLRDIGCAGEARARNARRNVKVCPASAAADRGQLVDLVTQARGALPGAIAAGDLDAKEASKVTKALDRSVVVLADVDAAHLARTLSRARGALRRVCRVLRSG